jgi:hypothetical protein
MIPSPSWSIPIAEESKVVVFVILLYEVPAPGVGVEDMPQAIGG